MSWRSILAFLVFGVLASAPSSAQTPQFPASWEGIWELTTTERSCLDGSFISAYADTDTICAGETFGFEEAGFALDCTGTLDDDSIDYTCSGSFELFPGCTVTYSSTGSGTRNGGNISGSERFTITYVGDCFTLEDECTDMDIVGVRLDPTPGTCGTVPVASATWGMLKARFR